MKNVFVKSSIVRCPKKYGKLIRHCDVLQEFGNVPEDIGYIEIPKEFLDNKYVYLLCVYSIFKPEYGQFICEDDIIFNYYKTEEKAKNVGKQVLNDSFNKFECLEKEDIDKYIEYNFSIVQIYTDRHSFKNDEERELYYKENLNKIDLYDLLIDLSGGYRLSYYDYNGNLLTNDKVLSDHYNNFSFKSLLGYHTNKFKIGDIVKFKYSNNQCKGIIIGKYEPDTKNIYESKDPYHFKEGYNIEYFIDENSICNENWQEPYFDEDLEEVKLWKKIN